MKTATTLHRLSTRQTSTRIQADRSVAKGLQIRNVLIPIDFSATSLEEIQCGLPLIKPFGPDLHLVHFFELDHPLSSMLPMPLILPEAEVGERVRHHLKDVAK